MLSDRNQTTLNQALMVLMALMAVAGLSLLVKTFYMVKPQPTALTEHTITLSASGDAVGVPDVARINLGVLEEGDTVAAATSAGTTKMNAIVEALKQTGVEDDDLKTTAYSLTPRYNYDVQPYKIEKYQLQQTVDVTVRNFDKLSEVVDVATKAGANSVASPRFEINDPEDVKSKARQEALAKVKQRADDLAAATGVGVGEMVSFTETEPTTTPAPYPDYRATGAEQMPAFQAGSETVTVEVSVTYALK